MSKLSTMLTMTAMAAAFSGTQQYGGHVVSARYKEPEPEWKSKKCKSCHSCNSFCNGKWSKPNQNACRMYQKRLK